MDDQIGVAADRAGEVAIVAFGQAVVADRLGRVGRAFEAFKQAELDDVFFRAALGGVEQLLDVGAVGEIAGTVAVGFGGLDVVEQARGIGIFVDAIDRGLHPIFENFCDRLIGGEHALFDELVAGGMDHRIGDNGASLIVEANFDFGHFQIQRAVGKATLTQGRGEFPAFLDHGGKGGIGSIGCRQAVEDGLCLFVGELGAAVNDRINELGLSNFSGGRDVEQRALGQAVNVGLEGANAVAQFGRQHRQDAIHKVGRVSALNGLLVHRAAGFDVVGDIGNMDGE